MINIAEGNTYPVYLNIESFSGRGLIRAWMTEEEVIKYAEKLFDEDIVYVKDDNKNPVQLLDIAINSADDIYSVRQVYTDCEEGQFEDTLEILLDNSRE